MSIPAFIQHILPEQSAARPGSVMWVQEKTGYTKIPDSWDLHCSKETGVTGEKSVKKEPLENFELRTT